MPKCNRSPERGAVLILVELLAVFLVLLAALAVDGSLLLASKAQHRHIAEYVALESLKTFGKSAGTKDARLESARLRAELIAGVNVFAAKPFLKDPTLPEAIGANTSSNPAQPNGRIVPGVWHFRPPVDCATAPSPCPCNNGVWEGPCFREVNIESDPDEPNAFRAELQLRSNSPVRTFFARVAGQNEVTMSSTATAAIYPRHGVFLVDLSRSSARESHVAIERSGHTTSTNPPPFTQAAEYAFKITNKTCPNDYSNPCLSTTPPACTLAGGTSTVLFTDMWNKVETINFFPRTIILENRPNGALTPPLHFKSDYRCFGVNYQDLLSGDSFSENYLVDYYRSMTYLGPEPLNTMLRGVFEGLSLISSQAAAGDLVGAIGFDYSAAVDRRTLALVPPETTNAAFQNFLSAINLDTQTDATVISRLKDYLFFPRLEGGANYPEALRRAATMLLNAPNREESESFVVLLSDGLTSCTEGRVCGSDEASYLASMNETQALVNSLYVPNRIALHTMLIGGAPVMPHTLVMQSPRDPSRCMTEEEARYSVPPVAFTDPLTGANAFSAAIMGSGYYYRPNELYSLSRDTQGVWAPIRTCCKKSGTCADVQSDLRTACATGPGLKSVANVSDANGRLFCDPVLYDNQTQDLAYKRAQIRDALSRIIARNPYTLVE